MRRRSRARAASRSSRAPCAAASDARCHHRHPDAAAPPRRRFPVVRLPATVSRGRVKRSPASACWLLALSALLALFACAGGVAASPLATPAAIAQWARFEASYAPDVTPANPFDPDEI